MQSRDSALNHPTTETNTRDGKCSARRPGVKDSAEEAVKFNCYCRSDNNSSLAAPVGGDAVAWC